MKRTSHQGIRNRLDPFSFTLDEGVIPPLDPTGMALVFHRLTRMMVLQALRELSDRGITDGAVIQILEQDPGLRNSRLVENLSLWLVRNVPLRFFRDGVLRARYLGRILDLIRIFRSARGNPVSDEKKLWKRFSAWVILLFDVLDLQVITSVTHPEWWSDYSVMAPRHHPHLLGVSGEPLNIYPFLTEHDGKLWVWDGDLESHEFFRSGIKKRLDGDVEVSALGEIYCRLLVPGAARRLLKREDQSVFDLDALDRIRAAVKSKEANKLMTALQAYRFHLYRQRGLGRPRNHYLDFLVVRANWEAGGDDPSRQLESLLSRAPGMRAPFDLLIRVFHRAGRFGQAERWMKLRRRVVVSPPENRDEVIEVPEPRRKKGDRMDQALKDMRERRDEEPLIKILGREAELREAMEILSCMQRNHVLVVGDPGVGKTAFVRYLVDWIGRQENSEALHDIPVFQLDLNALIAGVQYRGQLEEKLLKQLDTVAREAGILFLDDVHEFLGDGMSRHSLADMGVMLKPYLDRGDFRVIAATSHSRYSRMVENGGVFVRLFQKLELDELELPVIHRILEQRSTLFSEFHGVEIDLPGVIRHIELVKQFFRDRMLPDKALELLDRTCSRVAHSPAPSGGGRLPRVRGDDFLSTLAEARGVELAALSAPLQQRLRHLDHAMRRSIVGQDHVLDAMMRRLVPSRMGMKINPERPDGVFLFIGPTGVGKTETARVLCRELYGDERKLLRIDMSEYMEEIAVTRLVGAAPGYVGYDDGNQLIDDILRDPYRVVLLDEIEKAHPLLINIFLQVFDSGLLTDSRGRRAYFDKAVIIMTSNVGSGAVVSAPIGFPSDGKAAPVPTRTAQTRAMKRFFRPEFLNRVDEIVHFHSLGRDHARRIVKIHLDRLNSRFIPRGLEIRCSAAVVERLADLGFSPEYGAREILRTIEKEVMRPVAQTLLESRRPVRRIHVGVDGDGGRLVLRRSYSG